jgi:hypothetical protein
VPVPPLLEDDFALAGVPLALDTAELRLTFGDPDSLVSLPNPLDESAVINEWFYDGFRVQYLTPEQPLGYLITGRGEATARGVRVGDPARFVERLYGTPSGGDDTTLRYLDVSDPEVTRIIDFLVQQDTVRRIYVGVLLGQL